MALSDSLFQFHREYRLWNGRFVRSPRIAGLNMLSRWSTAVSQSGLRSLPDLFTVELIQFVFGVPMTNDADEHNKNDNLRNFKEKSPPFTAGMNPTNPPQPPELILSTAYL